MPSFIQQLWRDKLDVIFPRSCVHCGGIVENSRLRHLCPTCERQLFIVKPPHCTTCGHPFFGETDVNRICPHCEMLEPRFGEGRTAILLKGAGRSLVHALKYHDSLQILDDLTTIMADTPGFGDYVRGAILVPVPLHPRKERARGYNQSQLLAECVRRSVGGEATVQQLLLRKIHTDSQTHYDRSARQKNLKNAFALARGATINRASRYVLVDDVFTTGSTLNACAAVLRRRGAVNLDVVTFGHG
jgi:ComF family protein